MSIIKPGNADEIRIIVEERISAVEKNYGTPETVTIEWRGTPRSIPVISMPVDLLHYNPDTHRIRAQQSTDPLLEKELREAPYGTAAQDYLHKLLMGEPADPSKIDPAFSALKDDIQEHGQNEPGIITRSGVLVNGNTRRAALKELGQSNIRVGVLPPDAGHEDLRSIELSLQLRRDHKRDYSFMNFLLAIDERINAGQLAAQIQSDFRIKATTFEQRRWILTLVREAIERSRVQTSNGDSVALRLVDFESHQGKLEELYRTWSELKKDSPDKAEALKEQRLMALAFGKAKTDLRLIEPDFAKLYMQEVLQDGTVESTPPVRIPGTNIKVSGPSPEVQALKQFTTKILRAKSICNSSNSATPEEQKQASDFLGNTFEKLEKALDRAGKQVRISKRRFAPSERVSDATEDLELAVSSVADARAKGEFDPSDLDEALVSFRSRLEKFALIVTRGANAESEGEGIAWLKNVVKLSQEK